MKDKDYVAVSFVDDKEMQKLNKKYKDKGKPTDVLSFPVSEKMEGGKFYVGDIVVNVEQAKRQAKEYGNTYEEEIAQLVAHGMLHLQGVHHEGDQ